MKMLHSAASLDLMAMLQSDCRMAPQGADSPVALQADSRQGEELPRHTGRIGSKATRARNARRRRQKARLRGEDEMQEEQQQKRETEVLNYNSHRLLRVLAVRDAFSRTPLDDFSLEVLMRRTWAYLDE